MDNSVKPMPLTTPLTQRRQTTPTPFDPEDEQEVEESAATGWTLKKLRPKHVDMCALMAQGMGNKQAAALLGWVPEYITTLLRQPLIKEKIKEFAEAADARLIALTQQSVEAIADVLVSGSHKEKINAARLQLEAVNRVGAGARAGVVINQQFVVHVPPKAATPHDWVAQHAPITIDQGSQ